jgi:hypothetical protein
MIGLPFLPESPRWLAKVDRVDEALHILANIQADGDLENPYVVAEFEEIITVLTAERLAPKSWRKFVYNGMWRRTLAGFSVQAWQQLSGANVMTYYIVYIFCNFPLGIFRTWPWLTDSQTWPTFPVRSISLPLVCNTPCSSYSHRSCSSLSIRSAGVLC